MVACPALTLEIPRLHHVLATDSALFPLATKIGVEGKQSRPKTSLHKDVRGWTSQIQEIVGLTEPFNLETETSNFKFNFVNILGFKCNMRFESQCCITILIKSIIQYFKGLVDVIYVFLCHSDYPSQD